MQDSLFSSNHASAEPEIIALGEDRLYLYHKTLPSNQANTLQRTLLGQLNWDQPEIRIHGKVLSIPRQQVWMGDQIARYRYSGRIFSPEPWHPAISQLKTRIEKTLGVEFNSVLCNLYRNGEDSVSWHADDEPELDASKPIASFSLGFERYFEIKPKYNTDMAGPAKMRLKLPHNSLLVMPPYFQNNWLHQLPKTRHSAELRINLTFRAVSKASA